MIRQYLALGLFGLLATLGIIRYFDFAYHQQLDQMGELSLIQTEAIYDAVLDTYAIAAQKDFDALMDNDDFIGMLVEFSKAFDERQKSVLRGRLFRLLHQHYVQMRKLHVRQFHLHTAEGDSLLRFHLPYENGDSLINLRTTVRKATREHTKATGFERGRIYPGFRYVYPVDHDGLHLGSVEFSLSFKGIEEKLKKLMPENGFQLIMTEESTVDSVFDWHQDFFTRSPWANRYYVESEALATDEHHVLSGGLAHHLAESVRENDAVKKSIAAQQSFSYPVIIGGEGYMISFIALNDTDDSHAGYIISYTKEDEILYLRNEYNLYKLTSSLALVLLLFMFSIILKQIKHIRTDRRRLQRFIDLQNSIVILTDGEKLIFANQRFYDFFGYKDLETFRGDYRCVCDRFVREKKFFSLDDVGEEEKNWLESLWNLPARSRIVQMHNSTGRPHAFSVNINQYDEGKYIVNFTDISDSMIEKMHLEEQASRDKLTGAFNRTYFENSIDAIRARYQVEGLLVGIIFFDIDFFKKINDTHGHVVGDSVLVELVKVVSAKLRRSDHLVHWGGEEFVIVIGVESVDGLLTVAEHLRATIEGHPFETIFHLTCSFGVAVGTSRTPIKEVIAQADEKLYAAKANGRNRVQG